MKLEKAEVGKAVNFGGIDVVVLGHEAGKTLVLAKEAIGDMAFDTDNSNNWSESSLRKYLNGEFLNSITKDSDNEAAIIASEVDLTADDGLTDYGKSTDKIFLLSVDQYRKHRYQIPNMDGWWWLVTPYSTASNGYAHYVRLVDSDGTLSGINAHYGDGGVRPAWYLKSDILVSVSDDEDNPLAEYSTKELLDEIGRRCSKEED